MVKLGLFQEEDDKGELTGRWQVADKDDDLVYATFDTEEEAEKERVRLQAEFDTEDEAGKEYLAWEKTFLSSHSISQDDLRSYLVNVILG